MLKRERVLLVLLMALALCGCAGEQPDSKKGGGVSAYKSVDGPAASRGSAIPATLVAALEKGEPFEVYSLLNIESVEAGSQPRTSGELRGYPVLGRLAPDAAARPKLVTALQSGMSRSDELPKCFLPRHAIRTLHEGKWYDVIICFECVQAAVYEGAATRPEKLYVARGVETIFDVLLKDAKIPLSRGFEKR